MIEFKKGMTIGQIVDGLADDYFAAGADAFTANLLALRDVESALADFSNNAIEIVTSILRGPASEVGE